jgi:uncharacterized membrane protein
MIPQTIHALVSTTTPSREDFEDVYSYQSKTRGVSALAMLITLVIVILLVSFIGYMLWNVVIAGADKDDTGLFTFAKKADSMWQILGLFVFTSLFVGGCCPVTPVSAAE